MLVRICISIAILGMLHFDSGRSGLQKRVDPKPPLNQRPSAIASKGPLSIAASQIRQYQQGYDAKVWLSNKGTMGLQAWGPGAPPAGSCGTGLGFEYPLGDCVEHLQGAGPVIGGIVDGVRMVSEAYNSDDTRSEFFGNPNGSDSFYVVGTGVSDNDVYVSYTDTFHTPVVSGHIPMGIKILQKSYAWTAGKIGPILPFEFSFINIGKKVIHDAYIGFIADPDVGPINISQYWAHNYACYLPSARTGYVSNSVDLASTPLGVTILSLPKTLYSLKYIFQWHGFSEPGTIDSTIYSWMSGEAFIDPIKPCQSSFSPTDTRFFFSFGPFATVNPGDTLKLGLALIGGLTVESGPNNLLQNAENALLFHGRGYVLPASVPGPALDISADTTRVVLHLRSASPGIDPWQVWDDSNQVAGSFPDTSWRRSNPPSGHSAGGRIFGGYRIYRNTIPSIDPQRDLLKELVVHGDSSSSSQAIDSTFIDSTVSKNQKYWYAVTAFSIPNRVILQIPFDSGRVQIDTLYGLSTESPPASDTISIITGVRNEGEPLPKIFSLSQNFPDPFNPTTTIEFSLPLRSRVTLEVYNILGEEIRVFDDNEYFEAGQYRQRFDASYLASGVYFYRLQATSISDPSKTFTQVRKMLLIR